MTKPLDHFVAALLSDAGLGSAAHVAVLDAIAFADSSCLPQTVFQIGDAPAGDWASTQALSSGLHGARVFLTVLPACYFTGFWPY